MTPYEHSDSLTRHMKLLTLTRINCCDPSLIQSGSVMTDEGSTLVKIASNINRFHQYLCAFRINQLAVRVNSQIIHFTILQQIHIK